MQARGAMVVAGTLLLAACAGSGVATERVDPVGSAPDVVRSSSQTDGELDQEPVATDEPSTAPPTEPPPTGPSSTVTPTTVAAPSTETDDTRDPDPSIGDSLFPALGSPDVDVVSYDVRLAYDPNSSSIAGQVELDVTVADDVAGLALDSVGPVVSSVDVDGAPADFDSSDDELLIDLPPGAPRSVSVVVSYEASVGATIGATGFPTGWNVTTGGAHVLNEPDGARTWLPSNDHPLDKATWRFELTVPDGTAAIANGALTTEPDDRSDGRPDTWVWELDEPMPTYLVQVLVGDYEVIDGGTYTAADGSEIPLTHVVPSGRADDYDASIDGIAEQMAFFEDLFGPYPLERYGLAFVEGFGGGAMETQGRSMFPAEGVWNDEGDLTAQLLLAHELAHQWFGNAVSPADWGDIWLNESFATYLEWMWLDEIGLRDLGTQAVRSLEARQGPGPITGDPTVEEMFGFEVYGGGAPVLHALRLTLGDDVFFETLRRWVVEYEGAATTEDFVALASQVHGDELEEFFEEWLFSADLPDEYPG